jgi:hypothetical protein
LEVQTGCPISDEVGEKVKMSNKDKKKSKNGIKAVSFMIFRTGSILIVGMCEEYVLYNIYEFLKDMLIKEYQQIHQTGMVSSDAVAAKDKKKKIRRKNVIITTSILST